MDESKEALLEYFLIPYRETPPPPLSSLNHKSKPKSPLKCLAQDHTMANARPRMEAYYNVCFNVPRTKKRLDAFANSRSCSRFEKRKTTFF